LTDQQVATLGSEFGDMLSGGTFSLRSAFPEEFDETPLKDLPRLVFHYNRRSAGRLRQLIDRINTFPQHVEDASAKAVPTPAGL
jgi:hypothetical protein